MSNNMTAKASAHIDAPASEVWDALINPEKIKQYFFGTTAISDWKVGSPLEFRGEYEGKQYHDKGTILEMEPEKTLKYTYFSSMSGKEDRPENYANVTYTLEEEKDGTRLTITQEGVGSEKEKEHSEGNWAKVLESLNKVVAVHH